MVTVSLMVETVLVLMVLMTVLMVVKVLVTVVVTVLTVVIVIDLPLAQTSTSCHTRPHVLAAGSDGSSLRTSHTDCILGPRHTSGTGELSPTLSLCSSLRGILESPAQSGKAGELSTFLPPSQTLDPPSHSVVLPHPGAQNPRVPTQMAGGHGAEGAAACAASEALYTGETEVRTAPCLPEGPSKGPSRGGTGRRDLALPEQRERL